MSAARERVQAFLSTWYGASVLKKGDANAIELAFAEAMNADPQIEAAAREYLDSTRRIQEERCFITATARAGLQKAIARKESLNDD